MPKSKLDLKNLEIKSFTTSLPKHLKGGAFGDINKDKLDSKGMTLCETDITCYTEMSCWSDCTC